MSFFKKLLGGDFDSNRAEADRFFEAQAWGDAKLAYERALAKGKDQPAETKEGVSARIRECRRRLAAAHVERADALAHAGEHEAALEAIQSAIEVAPDEEARERYRKRIDELHAAEARGAFDDDALSSDEDRLELIAAQWDDEQMDEYDEYGDSFRVATLTIQESESLDDVGKALETLQALATEHGDQARYLHLEIGRALLRLGRKEEGVESLRRMLARVGNDQGEVARIHAHVALAEAAMEASDDATAERELREAAEISPDLTAGHLRLGSFLRTRGRYKEAAVALEAAARTMGELRPDVRVIREIGLNQVALGDEESAIETLEGLVQLQAQQDNLDLDPVSATTLATLYEKRGDPARAADFFRHLARGSDVGRHFQYHREAARLLRAAGDEPRAREHLVKARELAPDDENRAAIDALIGTT